MIRTALPNLALGLTLSTRIPSVTGLLGPVSAKDIAIRLLSSG
jgi:hypothetical protein